MMETLGTHPTGSAEIFDLASSTSMGGRCWCGRSAGASIAPPPRNLHSFPFASEGQILRTVAHELRNPLTALVTSAEVLNEDFDVLDTDQKRAILGSMHRGALWLHSLVENLLCDATIRDGRFTVRRQPVSLADIVLDVQPVVEPILARRQQHLLLAPGDTPDVVADPRRIGQVLVNLICNASKYGPANAAVLVTLDVRGEYVRANVADEGAGIPPGDEARVFEAFFRGANARRSGEAGVGLGLSIVKAVVEAHGGNYGAYNRPEGGACFWFDLPTKAAFESTGDEPETEIGRGRR